jgi:hypothetical protein
MLAIVPSEIVVVVVGREQMVMEIVELIHQHWTREFGKEFASL